MNPTISVIVPVFKVEKYLDNCIESLVNQTYKKLEIILVDDGSPDNCPAICDKWSEKDERIKVIHKNNEGVSSARNAGLDVAEGSFIGFVDGDDIVSEDFYETLLDEALKNEADVSACAFSYLNDNYGIYKKELSYIKSPRQYTSTELLNEYFDSCKGEWVSFCNKIIKSDLFVGLRFPQGRVFEDWTLAPMIYFKAKKICFNPECKYGYVVHEGSAVRTQSIKTFSDCVSADYDHFCFFNSNGITEYNNRIRCFIISDFRKCVKVYDGSKDSKNILKNAYLKCQKLGVGYMEKLMYMFPGVFRALYKLKR